MSGTAVAEHALQQGEQPLPSGEVANAVADASLTPASPLRESQIQNAVAFLAHPKVRGSSVDSRRTFLAEKGLTGAEIDEAFRRVPDMPSNANSVGLPAAQGMPAAQAAPQKPYPVDGGGGAVASTLAQLQATQAPPAPQPIRWTQVVIGLGLLAATGYAIKEFLAPRVAHWLADGRARTSAAEAERKKDAAAVAAAIAAQTAEMQKTLEGLKGAVAALEQGKAAKSGPTDGEALTVKELRSELRAMATSLNEYGTSSKAAGQGEGSSRDLAEIKKLVATVAAQLAARPALTAASPFTGSATGQPAPSQAPYASPSPSRAQQGYYGDSPPALHAMHYPPAHAPNGAASAFAAAQPNGGAPSAASEDGGSPHMADPPHPASYMEVLEMLEKGDTPPNIRSDIDDAPPDPAAPPPLARMQPRPKPWEARAPAAAAAAAPWQPAANGAASGDSTAYPNPAPAFPPASRAALATSEGSAEAGSSHTDAWKPPAVPQPSMPRAPPARSTPPPAAEVPPSQDGGASSTGSTGAAAEAEPEAAAA